MNIPAQYQPNLHPILSILRPYHLYFPPPALHPMVTILHPHFPLILLDTLFIPKTGGGIIDMEKDNSVYDEKSVRKDHSRPYGDNDSKKSRSCHSLRSSYSENSDPSNQSQNGLNLYQRYEAAAQPRPPLALKYIWDSTISSFDRYSKLIEGFLMTVGA
jgi:hypothetical protein